MWVRQLGWWHSLCNIGNVIIPTDELTFNVKIIQSCSSHPQAVEDCPACHVWFPEEYLVANYPRLVSGLVHPSDWSGLTRSLSHVKYVNHWGELTHFNSPWVVRHQVAPRRPGSELHHGTLSGPRLPRRYGSGTRFCGQDMFRYSVWAVPVFCLLVYKSHISWHSYIIVIVIVIVCVSDYHSSIIVFYHSYIISPICIYMPHKTLGPSKWLAETGPTKTTICPISLGQNL